MSQAEENDTFPLQNIESIYEELTKVVNAKNEIQTTITTDSEELTKHEVKAEELEDALHNLRLKITTNPILKKLNIACEEEAVDQRKSAEGIYSELPDISSKLEMYDEHFVKFKEEQKTLNKLHCSLKDKLENCLIQLTSSKAEYEKGLYNSEMTKKDILSKYHELKNEIESLSKLISQEKDISRSLSFQKDCKLTLLQKMREIKEQNSKLLTNIDNLAMKTNDFSKLETRQIELNEEIESLGEQRKEMMNKIEECKKKISDEKLLRNKLSEDLRKKEIFSKKKKLFDSIQEMKIKSKARHEEILKLKANKQAQEKLLSQIDSEIESCRCKNNEIIDEIITQKKQKEILIEEKEQLDNTENKFNEKMQELNEKIANFSGNKNKLEVSINVVNEKKSLIISEIDKTEVKLRETSSLIEGLNEQIANLQVEITEKEKIPETPCYLEMEKENEILDSKIKKYLKAIEVLKKKRAASILNKRKNYYESTDSDDSNLLPKKSRI